MLLIKADQRGVHGECGVPESLASIGSPHMEMQICRSSLIIQFAEHSACALREHKTKSHVWPKNRYSYAPKKMGGPLPVPFTVVARRGL